MAQPRRRTLLLSVTGILLGLAGLAGRGWLSPIDQPDPGRSAVQAESVERHDVAVLSVDFDPPLTSSKASVRKPSVLVVIDNRGVETETGLTLEIRLSGDSQSDVLTRVAEPIGSVGPGEARVVRLSASGELPLEYGRWLTAQVGPVHGETNVANNAKTVRLDGRAEGKTQ